jgi:hypothetical protein
VAQVDEAVGETSVCGWQGDYSLLFQAEDCAMSKLLEEPSGERKNSANVTRFTEFVNGRHGRDLRTYDELYMRRR